MKYTVKKFIVPALFLGLLVLTVSHCPSPSNVKSGDFNYPVLNPNPEHFLTIHGTIDASLYPTFYVGWYASDHAVRCIYSTSWLEGASAPYSVKIPLPFPMNGDDFSVKFATDGVLAGRCHWKFSGVFMTTDGKGWPVPLVQTNSYQLKPGQSPNGVIKRACARVKLDGRHGGFADAPSLDCNWIEPEDPNASVLGGLLWWHPEATNLEVHISKGHATRQDDRIELP